MKRIPLDQGLARHTAQLLRATGWDALHVEEINLERADDVRILAYAREHGYVCITLDHDFHSHLALAQAGAPSVIFLRLEGLRAAEQANLIESVWKICENTLCDGAAVTVDAGGRIRIRQLPLT